MSSIEAPAESQSDAFLVPTTPKRKLKQQASKAFEQSDDDVFAESPVKRGRQTPRKPRAQNTPRKKAGKGAKGKNIDWTTSMVDDEAQEEPLFTEKSPNSSTLCAEASSSPFKFSEASANSAAAVADNGKNCL